MRKKLEAHDEQRLVFHGTFSRYGWKSGYLYPLRTVLLKNIQAEDGERVCDHIWMNLTKGLEALGELNAGDVIEFHARVKEYVKGYVNRREWIDERELDYKLSHPTKFRVLS